MNNTLLSSLHKNLPAIKAVEREYRLPALSGTERQRAWARMIRADFIPTLLRGIMEATKDHSAVDAKEVFNFVTASRNETRADVWIEIMRPHRDAPLAFILAQPAMEAERQRKRQEELAEQKRIQAKGLETRKLTKAAGLFEEQHSLPPVDSPSGSTSQQNFGRRCRHALLRDLTADEWLSRKDEIEKQVDAGYWIGKYLKHEKSTMAAANQSAQMSTTLVTPS